MESGAGRLILIILLLPFVIADSANNTILNASTINTSMNITDTIYFDETDVQPEYIYIKKLRDSEDSGNWITVNVTTPNTEITPSGIPAYETFSDTEVVITSGVITDALELVFPVTTCDISEFSPSITYTCTNGIVTASGVSIPVTLSILQAEEDQGGGSGGTTLPYGDDFEPISVSEPTTNKFLNATNNLKEFIVGAIASPKGFIAEWNELGIFDKTLGISFLAIVIIFIVFITYSISKKSKNVKKDFLD